MRKILALTLVMVLAMAGMASAAVTLGGSFKVEYVVDTDEEAAGKADESAALTLTVDAEDEGIWDLSADLKIKDGGSFEVGDWTFDLNDDLFSVELWGGDVEKDQIATPLKFVATEDPSTADGVARMRLTTDLVGLADLTLDYQPSTLFVFGSKAIDDVTLGGAVKKDLEKEGMVAAGHVKYVFGPATLTGEVGVDTIKADEDNLFLGGKVDYKLNEQLTISGKVTHKAEGLDADKPLVIEPSVTYTEDLFKVTGKYTRTDFTAKNAEGKATNKLTANVTYRSNEDVAFDDLFDDYDKLTGYAAFAEVAYTTAREAKSDNEPLTELNLKGAGAAVPGMVWLLGEFNYAADKDLVEDGDFELIAGNNNLTDAVVAKAEDYMRLDAEATVKVTDKVSIVPSVAYGAWNAVTIEKNQAKDADWAWTGDGDSVSSVSSKKANALELGAELTYKLSDAAKVGLSYTNRTQKLEDATATPEELKDSFVKVYFSTSF